MSESKIRGKILVGLWTAGKPMTLQAISEKVGLPSSSTMGYLLGLIKADYVSVPETHQYALTTLGKQAIGLPNVDQTLATNILQTVPYEEAFHFHDAQNMYLNVYANSLQDFVDKIQTIDLRSIQFHLPRKDFENWVRSLGDIELAKKIEIMRLSHLTGENLRNELYQAAKARIEELTQIAS
ncbi:MAG: DUF5752 family protein [Candidatus Bathyarchaeota archaeon]|nr:DUF5752 family protein [Candidatus Bathyarchaeota archaeon]